ncbi:MAG: hypothetical protein ACK4NY_19905 [Spirosomataceae bacterium]
MKKKLPEDEFTKMKAFAKELFPNPEEIETIVPDFVHEQEIHRIKQGVRTEQFFFITDMLDFEIKFALGLESIGYNSETFDLRQYFNIIESDGTLPLMTLLGRETFKMANLNIVSFAKPKYIVLLPIKHNNGQVLLTKRVISPWQITIDGKITAFLSEYTIIGGYKGEGLNPRFLDVIPEAKVEFDKIVSMMLTIQPHFKNPFSPKETLLLKYYNENEGNSPQVTAGENNITVQTLYDYNKKILSKAKKFFGENVAFTSAKMVAKHLKDNGFLK